METLNPQYSSLLSEHSDKLRIIRKENAFYRFLDSIMPDGIKEIVKYSFSDMGVTCIRVFMYFNENISDSDMQLFFSFAKKLKNNRFTFEKFFREDTGTFSYKFERKYEGGYDCYLILFENAPNVDGCVIKKKTVKKEVFYSDCGELEKKF